MINQILELKQELIKEIIVVDDNSTDGTPKEVERIAGVILVKRTGKRSLVESLNTGIKLATSEYVIWMDSDLQMSPLKIPFFMEEATLGHDVIIGSRFLAGGSDERYREGDNYVNLVHRKLSFAMSLILKHFFKKKFTDLSSGFICIKKSIFDEYSLSGVYADYFLELLIYLDKKSFKTIEIPYQLIHRRYGKSKTQELGYWGLVKYGSYFIKSLMIKKLFK